MFNKYILCYLFLTCNLADKPCQLSEHSKLPYRLCYYNFVQELVKTFLKTYYLMNLIFNDRRKKYQGFQLLFRHPVCYQTLELDFFEVVLI